MPDHDYIIKYFFYFCK